MRAQLAALVLMLLLVLGAASCDENGSPPVSPHPEGQVTVTLFFSEPFAAMLVPEEREIRSSLSALPVAVLEALCDGPATEGLHPTLPPETRILGVEVVEGTAFVNFSRDLVDMGWGGTAGERLLVNSVVYSLTVFPGIDRVQFLIDGVVPSTIWGHTDAREPFEPEPTVGMLVQDPERLEALQRAVDDGADTWRLDPLKVLLREAAGIGLFVSAGDVTTVSRPDKGQASFAVEAHGRTWVVDMVQPVKTGSRGIWVLSEVTPSWDD